MIDSFREALNRLRSFFRKQPMDTDLEAELAQHLDLAVEENIRLGMSTDEARRQALVRFGGMESAKELHRDARGLPTLDSVLQDLRYTFRTLRRDAGFTATAVLIVGLGIGACSMIFSVLNTLLIRPLPFRDPGRLVWIANNGKSGLSGETVQVGHVLDFRELNRSFSDVAAYFAFYGVGDSKLSGQGEPERLRACRSLKIFSPFSAFSLNWEDCSRRKSANGTGRKSYW